MVINGCKIYRYINGFNHSCVQRTIPNTPKPLTQITLAVLKSMKWRIE